MRTFYIGFSKSKSKLAFVSKLIRLIQGTPFSHVFVRFEAKSFDRSLIYQASGLKVNFENIETFNSHAAVVREFEITVSDEVYKNIMQFAIDQTGKPYSSKQLFGMLAVCVFRLFGRKIKNPYRDRKDAFICSEIAACILKQSGVDVDYDEDSLGPKEVFEILVNKEISDGNITV